MNFAFFGTDSFSKIVLEKLKKMGMMPRLIVATSDKPSGRGQRIKKQETRVWAEENDIPILQPEKLDASFINQLISFPKENNFKEWDVFVVASYGKIIPNEILDMPTKKTLNVHPSLLPLYRGASPIESAMLDDSKETGVTIMLVDEEMDHGPILNQEVAIFHEWPKRQEVEDRLATVGGKLLADTLPLWMADQIEPQEQDHANATYTQKITKNMGKVDVSNIISDYELDSPKDRVTFLKIQTLSPWPNVFFFIKHKEREMRVKVTQAEWNGKLEVLKVIPEGKKEMDFKAFKQGFVK